MKKNKISIAIVLFLMFAMATSLVALPTVFAQDNWSIYIDGRTSDWRIRGEVRLDNSRQVDTFTGIMLRVRTPGATDWTLLGPFSTDDGRLDYYYDSWTVEGTYSFQYIVPAQDPLPENPATEDGRWYSDTVDLPYAIVRRTTYPFINALPNPAGIGQEVLLHVGITTALQLDGMQWEDLTVTVTRPDGTTETLGPYATDSTGGTGGVFVPAQTGDYTLQTHFPEQQTTTTKRARNVAVGSIMLASDSEILTLVVQEEPHPTHPGYPLPTEYWTRPIDAQLREWHMIAGSSWETDYNQGPESAHILWATPFAIGGVAGGGYASNHAFDIGDAYAGKWSSRFIIAGIALTQTDPVVSPTHTIATDIRTGEELWRLPFTFSFGQIYYHTSMNRHCAYAYM
jgi:hypothetical protein